MGHPEIDDKLDDFEVSGPTHMRSNGAGSKIVTDWDNAVHRRCAVASLVNGTYVMENDRLKCRGFDDAELAPAWWQNFGFVRVKSFINDTDLNDRFSYGAIFELVVPSPRHPSAPRYVVAFRGTMLCHPKFMAELLEDFWVLFNTLKDYRRFKSTDPCVDKLISCSDPVWLAGHSLGASMALEIGRNQMLEKGRNIPTFLFNPPHVSPAKFIHKVLTEEHKTRLYTVSFALKFCFANILPGYNQRTKQLFQQLAPWEPELYINQDDTICRGYYDYFMQRHLVSKMHPRFTMTAGRVSYRDMCISMFTEKVQPHLLPSARLWASSTQKEEAHNLRQWWKSNTDLGMSTSRFVYDATNAALHAFA